MIIETLSELIQGHKITNSTRFHKKEYIQGQLDYFVHFDMKTLRDLAKGFYNQINDQEFDQLISHKYHEYRLLALLILIKRMNDDNIKDIYNKYYHYIKYVNNWDLVDVSAPDIVGGYVEKFQDYQILFNYAKSDNMWINRIASVACLKLIRNHHLDIALNVIEKLLFHKHDLMHKANGWMLREIGKKNRDLLNQFIKTHYKDMPRTTLRYAIERHEKNERKKILGGQLEWI
ncbi:MAG: DNA alkylation repair protein [Candidatus Izemoplasmatales bacterium]